MHFSLQLSVSNKKTTGIEFRMVYHVLKQLKCSLTFAVRSVMNLSALVWVTKWETCDRYLLMIISSADWCSATMARRIRFSRTISCSCRLSVRIELTNSSWGSPPSSMSLSSDRLSVYYNQQNTNIIETGNGS